MAKPGMAEKFLKDVRECSNKILKKPDWKTTGTVRNYLTLKRTSIYTGGGQKKVAFH